MVKPSDFDPVPGTCSVGRQVTCLSSTGSTNSHALRLSSPPDGLVVATLIQTGGHGRSGRVWHSPDGSLAFSVCLAPLPGAQNLVAIAAGLAGAMMAQGLCGMKPGLEGVGLRWPNDLMLAGSKAGGILLETCWKNGTISHLVVGIGLNVNVDVAQLPDDLKDRPGSLHQAAGKALCLRDVFTVFCSEFDRLLMALRHGEEASLLAAWQPYDLLVGVRVRATLSGGLLIGHGRGIDDKGRLLVKTGDSVQAVDSGDVMMVR